MTSAADAPDLGFQAEATARRFPTAAQVSSQFLTLQGAVAHSDMPPESGPTRLLPFSQLYEHGYLAYRREPFARYFAERHVALPLRKGDALFFNPALFHAAGENVSADLSRTANLMQVSACWSRPMERVDHLAVLGAVWAEVLRFKRTASAEQVNALVGALGDGYPFPTNLDRDPPPANGVGNCFVVSTAMGGPLNRSTVRPRRETWCGARSPRSGRESSCSSSLRCKQTGEALDWVLRRSDASLRVCAKL